MVGFAPGGGTDVTARVFAQKMTGPLDQPVVVGNRTGVAGSIAAEQVATSPPDGYRLLMLASGTFQYGMFSTNLPYRLERDFAAISIVTVCPLVLVVRPSVPARSVAEMLALARPRAGQLHYG